MGKEMTLKETKKRLEHYQWLFAGVRKAVRTIADYSYIREIDIHNSPKDLMQYTALGAMRFTRLFSEKMFVYGPFNEITKDRPIIGENPFQDWKKISDEIWEEINNKTSLMAPRDPSIDSPRYPLSLKYKCSTDNCQNVIDRHKDKSTYPKCKKCA